MRLWLDEMVPGEVARQLRSMGHDVRAVQEPENRWAWGLEDADQLEAAVRQGRVLVTYNLRDFIPLSQQSAQARKTHLGIVLVHVRTIPPGNVGELVRSLHSLLKVHTGEDALKDQVIFLTVV